MKNAPIIISTMVSVSVLLGCASINEMDKAMLGKPSPAVAMYAAQVQFANDMCKAEGYVEDSAKSDDFVTMSGRRALSLSFYKKNYPEFSQYLKSSYAKYQSNGDEMSQTEKQQFCDDFNNEIGMNRNYNVRIMKSYEFARFFSPPTEEALKRSESGAALLTVLSAGAIVAGVAQTNSGNFSDAQEYYQAGSILADGISEPKKSIPCAAYEPFTKSSTSSKNPVWSSFNGIQNCN